jgi:glycosyltransferase involved in cell wall biosynthesis
MKISVIIPVFNERDTISKIVELVDKVDIEKEIIIVDDGSTDGTREILNDIKLSNAKIVFHKKNKGKGASIRTALKYVTGDIVIIQDADLEYDPQDYHKLIKPIIDKKAKVVYGSRYHKGLILNLWKLLYNFIMHIIFTLGVLILNILTDILYKQKITDEATCYKAFSSDVLKEIDLKCERFEFCPEVTAKVAKKGYKIYEVPITYNPRSREEGKKIGWRDGIEAIFTLIRYRFRD